MIINDDASIRDTSAAVSVDRNYDLEAAECDTAGIESARGGSAFRLARRPLTLAKMRAIADGALRQAIVTNPPHH